ncbi:hypothetical protein M3Y98_00931900 [Aphelenchoides besseyi]|nr:hypothetical protein M3Y98_00931900 [Aphelenchoides besseyi]KAI6194236.1 hypothetical protein M3Y96_01103400 [Aphelenchoides besseyi]
MESLEDEAQAFIDTPSSSTESGNREHGHGRFPLRRFGIRFGNRLLKIRIADRRDLGTKQFFCRHCLDAYFDTEEQLRNHSQTHEFEQLRQLKKCPRCGIMFFSDRSLVIHCRTAHGETLGFKCEICKKQFTSRHYYSLHLNSHNRISDFKCQRCDRMFGRMSDLTEHFQFCTNEEDKQQLNEVVE